MVLRPQTIAAPATAQAFLQGLQGCHIANWQRRGKYLLGQLQRQGQPGGWWGVHLRMTGQMLWLDATEPLQTHTRVRIFFENDRELRFVDPRTFGQMWWVAPPQPPEAVIRTLQTLGPEPLSPGFSPGYLLQRLGKIRRPIKTTLLDQAIVAGLGNIYADEALFLSHIHPCTPSYTLTPAQGEALHAAIVQVLHASLQEGGTTLRDFRNLKGLNGNYGSQAWVYGRFKQPCRRCATEIDRLKLSGRSSHFCPQCQPFLT